MADLNQNPVWTACSPVVVLIIFGLACGGGGATFGENSPGNAAYGGGTYVDDARVTTETPEGVGENGSLAVDPDTEFTFTVQKRLVDGAEQKRLVVVPPDEEARVVMDLDGYVDVRILFPPSSVLVMAQPVFSEEALASGRCLQPTNLRDAPQVCGDELIWFDKAGSRVLQTLRTPAYYYGTRLSPKRNHLVVADNFQSPATLHLLDTATGRTNVVPQDGAWFEGMWMHDEDVLVTAHFGRTTREEDAPSYLEIREWFPSADTDQAVLDRSVCFVRGNVRPEGCTSFVVADIDPIFSVGFSWIGISPDDRFVAVPAADADGTAVVLVVDRETDELRVVVDTYGPVGFTPDSRQMVGFGFDEPYESPSRLDEALNFSTGEGPHLRIVDLETLEVTVEPTPDVERPTFFVSRDSSDVVVVNFLGGEGMMIVDLSRHESREMAGPAVAARGRAADLSDPGARSRSLDRRVMSANDLISRTSIRESDIGCRERICHTGEEFGVSLREFVSRTGEQELWLVEARNLLRVDLELGFVEEIAIDGQPEHINILPGHDLLVIDAAHQQNIRFFDPAQHRVAHETSIELGWLAL